MAVNLTAPRGDIIYLKRRLKKGTPRPSSAPVTNSLSLAAPVPEATQKAAQKPPVAGKVVLTLTDNPVVRLNTRQSAMGNLIVKNATCFAWDAAGKSGTETGLQKNTVIPMYGNRKLVEFYKGEVVLSLRHIRNLKRLIVEADSGIMEVMLFDGSSVSVDSNNGENVVYISRISNILEIRVEKKTSSLTDTFNVISSL